MPPRGWHPTAEMVDKRRQTLRAHRPDEREAFLSKIDRSGDCWTWTAGRTPRGYGMFFFDRRQQGAHRVAWALAHGPVPPGLFVCHRCDNPPCVRPDHLFLGTHADNMADRDAKGRGNPPRGERSAATHLTDLDVVALRDMHRMGTPVLELARGFQISDAAVRHIVYRRTWRHVA